MAIIQVLQASVDLESESEFRVLIDNKSVKYITIDGGLYDPDDMCFEPSLVSLLPPLPSGDWNVGRISRSPTTGVGYFAAVSKTRLPGITKLWHPTQIDHLELRMGQKLRSNVYEATCSRSDSTIIAKFARFPWEVPQLEKETMAYELIDSHQIGPAFLGHLMEEGRAIGFIMARVKHGDINKHNFLIHDGKSTLIDFDNVSTAVSAGELEGELHNLEDELRDTSGRGGRVVESGPN
ncbi:hypothetical protein M426DRAFT_12791 [Hypoxylon sp. CI-4A]|nr:hypothetical protein M426DRAFT_12791 [Hypoxylon sp. CI-4A]